MSPQARAPPRGGLPTDALRLQDTDVLREIAIPSDSVSLEQQW
jgi:hypothetical protein